MLTASLGECALVTDIIPRIRADSLFARGASSTPAAFMFNWNGNSYSLITDDNATVTVSGNTRTATYGCTAIFQTPKKPQPVGSSFLCPLQFTVSD